MLSSDFSFDDVINAQSPSVSPSTSSTRFSSASSPVSPAPPDASRILVDPLAPDFPQLGVTLSNTHLGTGMQSEVFAGELGSDAVAVKIVAKRALGSTARKNLKREILIHSALKHPHVLPLLAYAEDAEHVFEVFPRIDCDLMQYVEARGGRLAESEARPVFAQMCAALQYCHEDQAVAHRDVKLENFLVHTAGLAAAVHVYLADFGFASRMRPRQLFTRPCGSPAYAAPEVLQLRPYCGRRADVFALGVTLYALLSGRFPREPLPPLLIDLSVLLSVSADDSSPVLSGSPGSPPGALSSPVSFPSDVPLSAAARELLHWLLQPSPRHRPTWPQLLASRFVAGGSGIGRSCSSVCGVECE